MKYWLKVNKDNIITDCVDIPYLNYIEWNGTILEPIDTGWYKLENGNVIIQPELIPVPSTETYIYPEVN